MNTEHAIKLVKDTFQQELSSALRLRRVTAPLFVESGHGLNDDLTGVEKPVSFFVPALNRHCEIVHSLAKWKRVKLWRVNMPAGFGIYTDMNAIRAFETPDDIHSLYVDHHFYQLGGVAATLSVSHAERARERYLQGVRSCLY